MANLDHLSYSSISSYLLCGHAWRLRYVDKTPSPTATTLVFGSAVHGAIESYLRSGGDLQEHWRAAWAQQCERDQQVDWGAESPEALADEGARILAAKKVQQGLAAVASNFDATGGVIEQRIELHVPSVAVPIVGYIDVITRDGVPGDFKTAARMWSDGKAEDDLQSLFYLAALNQAGATVPDWSFRHYVISKTQYPDMKTFEVQHSPSEIMWLFQLIQAAWRGIEAGVYPMNPSTWKCSAKYCEYWDMCRGRYYR